MNINFLDKLITPFGKYGYSIVGGILGIIGGFFIFYAVRYNNFGSGVVAFLMMFIVGYCWSKDSERGINGKN